MISQDTQIMKTVFNTFQIFLLLYSLFFSTSGLAESHSSNIEAAGCTLVILGASYAAGWNIEQIMGCKVINKGIPGNESFQLLERFEQDVAAQKPNYVLIWGFINDIYRAPRDKLDERLARIRTSYEAMFAISKEKNITPIFATEIIAGPQSGFKHWVMGLIGKLLGKSSYQDYINKHVVETNSWLTDFSLKNQIRLLDLKAALSTPSGERDLRYAKDDGSHISSEGYTALSIYTVQELK